MEYNIFLIAFNWVEMYIAVFKIGKLIIWDDFLWRWRGCFCSTSKNSTVWVQQRGKAGGRVHASYMPRLGGGHASQVPVDLSRRARAGDRGSVERAPGRRCNDHEPRPSEQHAHHRQRLCCPLGRLRLFCGQQCRESCPRRSLACQWLIQFKKSIHLLDKSYWH